MCGIAGIWRLTGKADERDQANVRAMIAAIEHRGPDGQGYHREGQLALGHCRLSIIDPSERGKQPMQTTDGNGIIAYNGEVYNFRELRRNLEREGVRFAGHCDTEVVLNALHVWGVEAAIRRFDGMFAFAYFDRRQNALWLARDRLGIKAISFARHAGSFYFASEDKGILAIDSFPVELSARAVTLKFASQNPDGLSSLFKRIGRVPPGGCWKISESGIEERRFWTMFEDVDPARLARGADRPDALQQRLDEILQRSVAMHCISDAPLATACSGGIDSGLVTVFAKQHVPDYHGYVVDPDIGISEREAAERTGASAGVEIRPVPIDRDIYLRNFPRAVYALESDGKSVSSPALLEMTRQCKRDGIKVLLTGEGSDELLGGYHWHRRSGLPWRHLDYPWRLLMSSRRRKTLRGELTRAPFFHSLGTANTFVFNNVLRGLSPDLVFLQSKLMEHLGPLPRHQDRAVAAAGLYDLHTHLQNLLHRHDRLSMSASVELRVPFVENDIIDFALHLHPRYKIRKTTTKWLLRSVSRKYLPQRNVDAPKLGFPLTDTYTRGCERILAGGWLADLMEWSRGELESMIEYATTYSATRQQLVGVELLARMYCNGEKAEDLGEELIGLNAAARQ